MAMIQICRSEEVQKLPNRIIKESINESESLSECTLFANDLYKRLITYADDYGRFNSDTAIIRARLYPREYDTVSEEDIINALSDLAGVGKISFYTPEVFGQKGKKAVYGSFPNWKDHQRIRDSKAKSPEPYDTSVNDWYLRRFVSLDMKAEIIERDGFKCRICGKFLTTCHDSKRFAKLGHGLYHIDHIVPCQQGGRATLENLRLTCPECNLKRKRKFTFKEMLEEAKMDLDGEKSVSPQLAANRRESPPESNPNPIQSESNPNPNPNPNICAEPESASTQNAILLPLNDGTDFPVTEDMVAEFSGLYPAVDIMQELRNMRGWLMNNPKNRKTMSGIRRFINSWLSREQNKPKNRRSQAASPARRELDSDEIAAIRQMMEE